MLFKFLLSADFSQNKLFRKTLSGIPSECQTDWIQIRPDILPGLIWVQTVCKSYQQATLEDRVKYIPCTRFCFVLVATPGIAVRHASVARHVTDCATRPGNTHGYIHREKQLSYSFIQGIWASFTNNGVSQK